MRHTDLMRCMGTIDLQTPDKEMLRVVVARELLVLKPTPIEQQRIDIAFDIAFEGLKNVPVRQSKEAYIFHVVRAYICSVRRQRRRGVKSVRALIALILHDSMEEARKAGIHPEAIRTQVHIRLGGEAATDMDALTKGEEDFEYVMQLRHHDVWEVIYAKLEDRLDNLRTLEYVPDKKQRAKVVETALWLPLLTQRLKHLIDREVRAHRLHHAFRGLAMSITHDITTELAMQQRRLAH